VLKHFFVCNKVHLMQYKNKAVEVSSRMPSDTVQPHAYLAKVRV